MNTKPIKFSDTVPVFLAKVFDQVNTLDFRNAVSVEEPDGVSGDKSFTLNKIVQRGLARYRLTKSLLTGNAMVPPTAPILPEQLLVDNFIANGMFIGTEWIIMNQGMTFFDPNLLDGHMSVISQGWTYPSGTGFQLGCRINFTGNKLTTANVNSILQYVQGYEQSSQNGFINLSGANMGAPTGAGLTAKNALVARSGWSVITN